ncbi:MAG: histidine phosphatase family protein, partial [Oscillospiraceae bacterium]|nr:histidine phosphatase family protein [Oscillospiraceae bacterium]
MTTKIFLVRHAEAEGNLFRIAHGQYDSIITPQGYRQLAWLRERFKDETLDAVYGSDLTRTRATASALYAPRG